ncbi:MAG: response regulator [Rhodospirillaceae bacterium]|nr:MAG: response regulator [Rhodospirillaceae bacterium]
MNKLADVRYMLIVLSALFAAGVALLIAFQIERSRDATLEDGFHDTQNLAENLAQYTRQSFLAVDLVLQSLTSPEFRDDFINPTKRDKANIVLRHRQELLQGVVAIVVLDPDGRLIASSNTRDPQQTDLSTHPALVAERDRMASGVTISPPFVASAGPAKGQYIMTLSRALESDSGQFLGTIQAVFALAYFENFYSRLNIGPHGSIGVARRDGILILRHPVRADVFGDSVVKTDVFKAHLGNPGGGQLYAKSPFDGVNRIVAYRDVPEVNVFVSVGLAVDDVLAGWYRSTVMESAAATALIVTVLLLAVAANRLLSSQKSDKELTIARLNCLAEASAEIAMVHHRQALADSVNRVIQYLIPGSHAVLRLSMQDAKGGGSFEPHNISVHMRSKAGLVIGSIDVSRPDRPAFNQQDMAVLTQLAHVVTVAIENLELFEQTKDLAVQAERAKDDEAEARRAIERVFATMSEGVYALDRDGCITFLNENAERLLSVPRDQVLGKNLWDLFPRLRGTVIQEKFTRCFSQQVPVEFEFENDALGTKRWSEVRAFPTKDGITVYNRDITQRIETESKLRQAQKMEAIGQLTGGMAHDFNNLLTVVLGSADTLVDALAGDEHLQRIAESVRDSALRGATLVARLLAFARRQALAPEPVDVNGLILGLEDLLTRTIGANIRIVIKRAEGLWQANIDPVQMENAILNLALNARDAMPEGGTLRIETKNGHLNSEVQSYDQILAGEYIVVVVTDTGTGMSADVLQRAFDPFFTTKPIGQGSGLGLSMVYGFVRQSGGYVRITSTSGQGTTVRMYLPRVPAAENASGAHLEQDNSPPGHERILLVEDDELVRGHLAETLSSLGYEVMPCATGAEVLGMIKSGIQADLLLTDIILAGGINGYRVAEQIKLLRPTMPVLYMSGYTENAMAQDGGLEPGVHFISKPFRRQQIAAKLRAVFAA